MTGFFSALLVRIFTGGIICTVAMMLAGDGPRREIVRLCCACLMIILILSPIRGAEWSLEEVLQGGSRVEEEISLGMERVKGQEYGVIAGQLSRWVEEQAAALDIACKAQVEYTVDEESRFTITAIRISGSLDEAQRQAAAQMILRDLGVAEEQLIWQGG